LASDPSNVTAFVVLTGLYEAQNDNDKALATINDGITRNPKSLPLYLLKADLYQRKNDIAKVAETFDTIYKLSPKETKYRLKLAEIYIEANKIDEAEAVLRSGVTAMPDSWDMKHALVLFLNEHRSPDAFQKEVANIMAADPKQTQPYIWLVDSYLSHNDVDKAKGLLNDIIAKNQFDALGMYARTALARIYYIQGDKDNAGKLVSAVLEKDQNNLDARFLHARMQADAGNLDNAIAELRAILRDRPKTKEALHVLSETLLAQNHPDLALETMNQLAELDPTNYAVRVRLAQMYQVNGDSHHAMDMLFLITKSEPKFAPAWETTARIAITLKDWATADMAIGTLDKLDGQHMTAIYLRGEMDAANGKPEDALAQYTQVVNADPGTPIAQQALLAMMPVYKKENKLDDAAHFLETLKTPTPISETLLGAVYLELKKPESAATAFDAAINANAKTPEPYIQRAHLYMNDKKYDAALDVLKKGAVVAPADIRPPIMEAEIYDDTGRYDEAIALYDQILKRNPQLDAVANNLAETIADYKANDQAALERARQVAERFVATTDPLFMDTLAWVYYKQGNQQNAQTFMDRAMAAIGDKAPAQMRYHYGAILLKANKSSEAKAQLQQATANGADYPGLDDAKKLLTGL
ncbi:MAG TPA: tetratricopeptide repeat protein, partial [Alphaproteobacteria bacterium]|nr:tetratricopeptide repeat protein [Alphaproteobacteria bacterium]